MTKKIPVDKAEPFNNPFAALAPRREELVQGRPPAPVAEPKGPARAVVRMERKGRGGKEVTVVEGMELKGSELERWLKELKQALGCGGAIEERAIMLQGDHRERLRAILPARGVRKVSIG
jgi:translation initiation factor 1